LTCHAHIWHHYELYTTQCKQEKILVNHYGIAQDIWKKMEEANKNPKSKKQALSMAS